VMEMDRKRPFVFEGVLRMVTHYLPGPHIHQ
jgi:hypothetical protein